MTDNVHITETGPREAEQEWEELILFQAHSCDSLRSTRRSVATA